MMNDAPRHGHYSFALLDKAQHGLASRAPRVLVVAELEPKCHSEQSTADAVGRAKHRRKRVCGTAAALAMSQPCSAITKRWPGEDGVVGRCQSQRLQADRLAELQTKQHCKGSCFQRACREASLRRR